MLLPTHTDTASAQLQRISLYPIFSSGLTIIGLYRDLVSIRQASRLSVACNLDRWHCLNQLPAECDSHEHRNKVSQNSAILMSINDFINDFSIWMSFRLINHPLVELAGCTISLQTHPTQKMESTFFRRAQRVLEIANGGSNECL